MIGLINWFSLDHYCVTFNQSPCESWYITQAGYLMLNKCRNSFLLGNTILECEYEIQLATIFARIYLEMQEFVVPRDRDLIVGLIGWMLCSSQVWWQTIPRHPVWIPPRYGAGILLFGFKFQNIQLLGFGIEMPTLMTYVVWTITCKLAY